jgi:hypothetical protein
MAEILPFEKGVTARKRIAGEESGLIVIFPGVRVEYHDGPTPTPRPKRGRKRRPAARAS